MEPINQVTQTPTKPPRPGMFSAIQGEDTSFIGAYRFFFQISWLFAPLFINQNALVGYTGFPMPGAYFLFPVVGQITFFLAFLASPASLILQLLVFNLYVTLVFFITNKKTKKLWMSLAISFIAVFLLWVVFKEFRWIVFNFISNLNLN